MSETNGVMMQCFHWYTPADGDFWKKLGGRAGELAHAGITALWLPPAYKGLGGASDVGYGVYDMYDLGEFDQKGSVRTKYGTRQEYLDAIRVLQAAGVQVYFDAVLNHRIGGDETETVKATPYPQNNRLTPKGEQREVRNYTRFRFPARNGKYSSFQWNWTHFDAVDYDEITRESGTVYLFEGKRFDDEVALENGNFAYLMGCDLDFQNKEVQDELINWGNWYLDTTGA
ncbi:MAG: alpha-amylase, partial [Deltaproteobacteria bacterium]|nr:alpha-amylase [Deltaproteobacteria bacterium]